MASHCCGWLFSSDATDNSICPNIHLSFNFGSQEPPIQGLCVYVYIHLHMICKHVHMYMYIHVCIYTHRDIDVYSTSSYVDKPGIEI